MNRRSQVTERKAVLIFSTTRLVRGLVVGRYLSRRHLSRLRVVGTERCGPFISHRTRRAPRLEKTCMSESGIDVLFFTLQGSTMQAELRGSYAPAQFAEWNSEVK